MAEKEKPKEESKIILEREYMVPLRSEWLKVPEYKRANKAVKALKEFIARHMKIYDRDLRKVKIDILVNNEIRFKGIRKPLPRIKVKALKYEDGTVGVKLVEVPKHIEFKVAREAKKAEEREAAVAKKAEVEKPTEKPEKKPEEKKESEETKEKEETSKVAMQDLEKARAKEAKHVSEAPVKEKIKTTPIRKALKK